MRFEKFLGVGWVSCVLFLGCGLMAPSNKRTLEGVTGTRNELVRAIRSRVPEVAAVDVDAQPGRQPIVSITS